jgi:pentatricopeptide repeat protein
LEVRSYNALLGACLAAGKYSQCLDVVRHIRVRTHMEIEKQ